MMLDSEKQSTAKPTFPKINLPLYSYRGEKEGKKRKEGENGQSIILSLSENPTKIDTISNCKSSSNKWNSKNQEDANYWYSRNTDYFYIDADFWNSNYMVYLINNPIS